METAGAVSQRGEFGPDQGIADLTNSWAVLTLRGVPEEDLEKLWKNRERAMVMWASSVAPRKWNNG